MSNQCFWACPIRPFWDLYGLPVRGRTIAVPRFFPYPIVCLTSQMVYRFLLLRISKLQRWKHVLCLPWGPWLAHPNGLFWILLFRLRIKVIGCLICRNFVIEYTFSNQSSQYSTRCIGTVHFPADDD